MKGSGTVTFTSANMSGKPAGRGGGTCSLPAGNINLGAKKITVNVYASKAKIILVNKYGQVLDARSLVSTNQVSNMTAVFDISDVPDTRLTDGAYIVISMYSSASYYSSIGTYAGETLALFTLNSITVTY